MGVTICKTRGNIMGLRIDLYNNISPKPRDKHAIVWAKMRTFNNNNVTIQ